MGRLLQRFLRIETPDYDTRTWCRLEPLLSYVFSFADHHLSIGLDFEFRWPYLGTETMRPILDPRGGEITNPDDMPRILSLVELATRIRPANPTRAPLALDRAAVKCFTL